MPWLLSLILLAGAIQADPPNVPAPTLVARLWAQYKERLMKHDAAALAELFADDARLMEANADDIVGRPTIEARLERAFAQRVRPVDLRVTPREVRRFSGFIYDQGDSIQTVAPTGDPRRAYDVYGRYFAVWAEQPDGQWKLSRLMLSPKEQPKR